MKTEFWYGNLPDDIKMNNMEVASERERWPFQAHGCV